MDAYIGEIRAFPFQYVPQGWLECNGSTQQVYQYQALYSLIGNIWGGKPNQTFVLPDLQGLTLLGPGVAYPDGVVNYQAGKTYGADSVALTSAAQVPAHNHQVTLHQIAAQNLTQFTQSTPTANQSWLSRAENVVSDTLAHAISAYEKAPAVTDTTLAPSTIAYFGAALPAPHDNHQPYLVLTYCICYDGEYPIKN